MSNRIMRKATNKAKELALYSLLRATLSKRKLDTKIAKALGGKKKKPGEAVRIPIKSGDKMKHLMGRYYIKAKIAEKDPDQKIAWITSGGPVEILHAAGITPIYPENHAAMIGTVRMADELCAAAEDMGYSRDLCSYARSDFGSIAKKKSPIGGSPRPDVLICCNNICGTVTKWYQELQRIFDVPLIMIDAPYQYGEDRVEAIDYMRSQLQNMMEQLEQITGKKIDPTHFLETLMRSREATALWKEIQDMLTHRPAPINSFDTFIQLAPIVTLRGTQQCIDYYKGLRAEIAKRIEDGVAAVPGEKYRLGWDNLAIWYKIQFLAKKFGEHKAALVVSTYAESFCYSAPYYNEDDMLGSLGANYLAGYINHSLDYRERELLEMAEKFHLNGFVMHSNRSCRAYSLGQYELAKRLEEKHGLPTIMIEGDQSDTRAWSDEQVATRIDAFMEVVASRAK